MKNMIQSLEDVPHSKHPRAAAFAASLSDLRHILSTLGRPRQLRTIGPGPAADAIHQENVSPVGRAACAREAVAAVHRGAADRAVALGGRRHLQTCLIKATALSWPRCLGSDDSAGRRWPDARLRAGKDYSPIPPWHDERYSGRTLLHGAAAAGGNAPVVDLLLSLGADPATRDAGGHTPLYCVANE